MPQPQEIIKAAGEQLLAHSLGQLKQVTDLWNSVQWVSCRNQVGTTEAERCRETGESIRLYPKLQESPTAAKAVLREFGLLALDKTGNAGQAVWTKKLHRPDPAHVTKFSTMLADAELRKQCHTYKDLLDRYPQKGHSVERLVAIHLANALLANNIPYPSSQGVNIYEWGPTLAYANGKKYGSIVPLTSAYSPEDIHNCFGCAIAAWVLGEFVHVKDDSVAVALKEVILTVIQKL